MAVPLAFHEAASRPLALNDLDRLAVYLFDRHHGPVAVADRLALAILEQQRHVLAPQVLVLHHVTPFNAPR